jgi:hypothetical protein
MDSNKIELEIINLIRKYTIEDFNLFKDYKKNKISKPEFEAKKKFTQNFYPIRDKYFKLIESHADSESFQKILDEIKELRKNAGLDF